MIIDLLLNENNLTETEKHLAHYILDKNNNLENITSIELGKQSFTSQSAVTRLYKKLGMKTYREFISTLIIERNEYFKIRDFPHQSPIQFFSSYEETQKTLSSLYAQILINTNLLLDKNVLIRVCNRLMNATSVDIYGLGISDTLAKQMHFKLQSIGIYSIYQNSFNPYYMKNMRDNKKNVSILIHLSELNNDILKISNELKLRNVYTVSILNKKHANVNISQDTLLFDVTDNEEIEFMNSSFAAEYIINLIFAMLLYRRKGTE